MTDNNIVEFLEIMTENGYTLEEAMRNYNYLLFNTELDQVVHDYCQSNADLRASLRRISRENNLTEAENMLD